VNWPAFLFWLYALLLKLSFFEKETCPTCGGSGRAPWKIERPS
jgi:hypothetical protein